jgi:two-component system response regulator (stage 0 sporulation protein F)
MLLARILVIDDEEPVRSLLRTALELQGYKVVEAQNGREGLQCYQAEPTDLVITDIQMPVMDGVQMLMELRRTFPRAKVIAISAGEKALDMARTLDAQHTLAKPFCLQELLAAVQALVS